MGVLGSRNPDTSVLDWLPQRDPQVQILNFLDSNGLLPMRLIRSNMLHVLYIYIHTHKHTHTSFIELINYAKRSRVALM